MVRLFATTASSIPAEMGSIRGTGQEDTGSPYLNSVISLLGTRTASFKFSATAYSAGIPERPGL